MGWGGLGGRKCGLVWFGFGHRFSRLEMGSIHGFLLDGRMGTTQNGCRASSIPNSSSPRQPSQHHIHKSLDAPPLCLPMLSSLPWLAGETFPSIARAVLADAFLAAVAHRRDAQSRASTCDGEVRAMACARGGGAWKEAELLYERRDQRSLPHRQPSHRSCLLLRLFCVGRLLLPSVTMAPWSSAWR